MSSSPALVKEQEFRKTFETLPSVLIQDPVRGCAYAISAEELEKYRTSADTWSNLNESTVSFTVPDGEAVDEVPPFLRDPGLTPSVLLRYPHGQASYFVPFDALQAYRIEQPTRPEEGNVISFILPRAMEMVEELPRLTRALLQSGTSGF